MSTTCLLVTARLQLSSEEYTMSQNSTEQKLTLSLKIFKCKTFWFTEWIFTVRQGGYFISHQLSATELYRKIMTKIRSAPMFWIFEHLIYVSSISWQCPQLLITTWAQDHFLLQISSWDKVAVVASKKRKRRMSWTHPSSGQWLRYLSRAKRGHTSLEPHQVRYYFTACGIL